MEETFGEIGERFARSGVSGLLGENLKGSLQIGISDVAPSSISELIGAPASMFEDIGTGVAELTRGNAIKGAERLAPRILSAPIRAYREATECVTNRSNQPVYYGDEPIKGDTYATLVRSLGFNPVSVSEKREEQWNETQIKRRYDGLRSDIYSRVRVYMIRDQEPKEWFDIQADIAEYNARVRRNEYQFVPQITDRTLKGVISRFRKVPTAERRRAKPIGLEAVDISTFESLVSRKSDGRQRRRSRRRPSRRPARRTAR